MLELHPQIRICKCWANTSHSTTTNSSSCNFQVVSKRVSAPNHLSSFHNWIRIILASFLHNFINPIRSDNKICTRVHALDIIFTLSCLRGRKVLFFLLSIVFPRPGQPCLNGIHSIFLLSDSVFMEIFRQLLIAHSTIVIWDSKHLSC